MLDGGKTWLCLGIGTVNISFVPAEAGKNGFPLLIVLIVWRDGEHQFCLGRGRQNGFPLLIVLIVRRAGGAVDV